MSAQQIDADPPKQPKRSDFAPVLRAFGLLITAIFGLVPFVLGIGAQSITRRRIPAYIVGPLAVGVFFALWRLTGWLQWRIGTGDPVWPSLVISLLMFVAFFSSGAAFIRELLPRRFSPASASSTPNERSA